MNSSDIHKEHTGNSRARAATTMRRRGVPDNYHFRHYRRQVAIEAHFSPKISMQIKDQITSFLSALDKHGHEYALKYIDFIVRPDGIASVVKDLYHKSAFIEGNYTLAQIAGNGRKSFSVKRANNPSPLGLSFDDLAPVIDQYFKLRLLNDSAIPITDYTKDLITSHLVGEINSGKGLNQAINDFKDLAISWTGRGGLADSRARTIAITESTRSMNFGGMIGAYVSGVDVDKTWVTSHDERVRGYRRPVKYPHTILDRSKSALLGSFYNGEPIRFPGDPDANLANIIQCRCALYYEEKPNPENVAGRVLANFLVDFFASIVITNLFNDNNSGTGANGAAS